METTRRHFLKGFAGCLVVAHMPIAFAADAERLRASTVLPTVQAPDGVTYQWIRTSLLGEPDVANLEWRLSKGWTFVSPKAHPSLISDIDDAIEHGGLVLMQKPSAEVAKSRMAERIDAMRPLPQLYGTLLAGDRVLIAGVNEAGFVEGPGDDDQWLVRYIGKDGEQTGVFPRHDLFVIGAVPRAYEPWDTTEDEFGGE